jgi:hypothetical protein
MGQRDRRDAVAAGDYPPLDAVMSMSRYLN